MIKRQRRAIHSRPTEIEPVEFSKINPICNSVKVLILSTKCNKDAINK